LGFTGQEEDDDLCLVNMNGRIYDPTLARFLTPDPLVSMRSPSQSWNRYSYANNSPMRFVDPSGLGPEDESPTYSGNGAPPGTHMECTNYACGYVGNTTGLPYGSYGWAGSSANNAVGANVGSFDEAGAGASSAAGILGELQQVGEAKGVAGTTGDAGDDDTGRVGREGGAGAWKANIYDPDKARGKMLASRLRDELVGPLEGKYQILVFNRAATVADVKTLGGHDVIIAVLGKGGQEAAMQLFNATGVPHDVASTRATVNLAFSEVGGGVTLGRVGIVPVTTLSLLGNRDVYIGNIAAHEFGHAITNWGFPQDHTTGGLMRPTIGTDDPVLHFTPNYLMQFVFYQ
jgi:RHS repeat-associated protein